GGEEVGRHEDVHVRADKLLPRRGRLALGSRRYAMALEDVAHGLVTDRIAQVRQGADDAVIAPRAIFLGQAHHQGFQLLVDLGAAWGLALWRAIEFLGDKLPVPGEDGVGLDDLGDFLQRFLSQLLGDLREGLASAVTQPYATFDLVAEDAIFGHQVRI